MACVCNDPGGKRRIQFVAPDGKRKAIRLGKCSKSDAEKIKNRVESLLSTRILGGSISRDDAMWLTGEGAFLRPKLELAGVIETSEPKAKRTRPKLSEFLTDYMTRHGASKKPGTRAVWRQVIENLNTILPAGIHLDEVTAGHAKEFHERLKGNGLSVTTIDKRIRFCRQFFTDAVDWELIQSNPFSKVKTTSGNAKSNVHVPSELIENQVMPVCDTTWKTILALCRFGGLRCPSEVLSLRWSDIDWENSRMAVREPKVEHHDGRGIRSCPIFAELRPYLNEAWEQARDGAEYVIDHADYRRAANSPDGWRSTNLRTQFGRILVRAGVPTWKRLFHSMRASRQTELERDFPLHVVCSWLGNSVRIAQKSYLLVTEDDFAKATGSGAECGAVGSKNASKVRQVGAARSSTIRQGIASFDGQTANNANLPTDSDINERRGQDSNSANVSMGKPHSEPKLAQNCAQLGSKASPTQAQLEIERLVERLTLDQQWKVAEFCRRLKNNG